MTAMTGCDWSRGSPSDTALDAAGVRFACRYLSSADTSKCITRAEADRHKAAGRGIVLVYEDTAGAARGGWPAGARHAAAAAAQAAGAGLGGAPVYFAADWDASPEEQPLISSYLDGAASVIGWARCGLYGGYWPVSRARAAGKARYFWGTRAWSGTGWDTCGWKPHILQGGATTIGGVACDWDTAWYGDYGQWKPDWAQEAIMTLPALSAGSADLPGQIQYVHRAQALVKVIGQVNGIPAAAGITTDGVYGEETAEGVRAVQQFFRITGDAVCGRITWTALITGSPT